MGPQHTDYKNIFKYMPTYSTNPKPNLTCLVAKLVIVSRMSKLDYQNKV